MKSRGRFVLSCVVVIIAVTAICLLLWVAGAFIIRASTNEKQQFRHPESNTYWQYVNYTAKANVGHNVSCVVCSLLPHDGDNPLVLSIAKPDLDDAFQAWSQAWQQWGNFSSAVPDEELVVRKAIQADLRVIYPLCLWTNDTDYPISTRTSSGVYVKHPRSNKNRTIIFEGLEDKQCRNSLVYPPDLVDSPIWEGPDRETLRRHTALLLPFGKIPIWNQLGRIPLGIPDWYWYCGPKRGLFWAFPRDQRGRCAMVQLNAHLEIHVGIPSENTRSKRNVALTNNLAIPDEHKLVSEGTRFAEILFPMFGVANVRRQLNKVHYRLALFVNETILAVESIRQELTALRLMTTQNRMALDMLLAKEGGVCVMIGQQCCTYIPPNDTPTGNISKVLEQMNKIARQMRNDEEGSQAWNFGFMSWFTGWKNMFFAFLPMLLLILLIICCAPMICQCITNMIQRSVQQYQMPALGESMCNPDYVSTINLKTLFDE